MTTQQERILDTAIAALGRTAGINARVHPVPNRQRKEADALVVFQTGGNKHRFRAEVKTMDRFATPAILKAQSKDARNPLLLVAPYVTREVAERCRQLRLPFIDTAGNAYLEAAGLLVYVAGQSRPIEFQRERFRALNPAGLKLAFAILCRPKLLTQSYRAIASAAGVALGTVSADMKDLGVRGFFDLGIRAEDRKPSDPEGMLQEWVTHYPIKLRPKLLLGRFRADPERLRQSALAPLNAYWGGEPAGEKLTQYLKPAHFTIYTDGPIAKLVAAGRMRADKGGNVEILEKFWNLPAEKPAGRNDAPDVVPPVLAYADLLATHDSRNAEAARIIYERRIAPAYDTAQ